MALFEDKRKPVDIYADGTPTVKAQNAQNKVVARIGGASALVDKNPPVDIYAKGSPTVRAQDAQGKAITKIGGASVLADKNPPVNIYADGSSASQSFGETRARNKAYVDASTPGPAQPPPGPAPNVPADGFYSNPSAMTAAEVGKTVLKAPFAAIGGVAQAAGMEAGQTPGQEDQKLASQTFPNTVLPYEQKTAIGGQAVTPAPDKVVGRADTRQADELLYGPEGRRVGGNWNPVPAAPTQGPVPVQGQQVTAQPAQQTEQFYEQDRNGNVVASTRPVQANTAPAAITPEQQPQTITGRLGGMDPDQAVRVQNDGFTFEGSAGDAAKFTANSATRNDPVAQKNRALQEEQRLARQPPSRSRVIGGSGGGSSSTPGPLNTFGDIMREKARRNLDRQNADIYDKDERRAIAREVHTDEMISKVLDRKENWDLQEERLQSDERRDSNRDSFTAGESDKQRRFLGGQKQLDRDVTMDEGEKTREQALAIQRGEIAGKAFIGGMTGTDVQQLENSTSGNINYAGKSMPSVPDKTTPWKMIKEKDADGVEQVTGSFNESTNEFIPRIGWQQIQGAKQHPELQNMNPGKPTMEERHYLETLRIRDPEEYERQRSIYGR